ncbi:hypothetical protein THAOC_12507, partial [Thalassiosira oceanica]
MEMGSGRTGQLPFLTQTRGSPPSSSPWVPPLSSSFGYSLCFPPTPSGIWATRLPRVGSGLPPPTGEAWCPPPRGLRAETSSPPLSDPTGGASSGLRAETLHSLPRLRDGAAAKGRRQSRLLPVLLPGQGAAETPCPSSGLRRPHPLGLGRVVLPRDSCGGWDPMRRSSRPRGPALMGRPTPRLGAGA